MNTPRITGRVPDRLTYIFQGTIIAIAGIGCADAAIRWMHWPWYATLATVLVLELAVVALLVRADYRRRLGERAYAYRVLSVAVGLLAVGINWFGHVQTSLIAAACFAGFSALGLGIALLTSGDRRRDHLRASGNLPPTTPAYGAWQWLMHPWLTWRARELAKRTPALGLYGSLAAAVDAKRDELRHAALKALLVDMIGEKYGDPLVAKVAVTTLDMDEITRRFAAAADYDAFVGELWARVPLGAAESAAIEPARQTQISAAPLPMTADVRPVEASRIPQIPARRVADVARALKAADRSLSPATIAAWLGKGESTVRGYLREETAEHPVVDRRTGDDRPNVGMYP